MTSDKVYFIDTNMINYESDICDSLTYMLYKLDIGHNGVVRHWMAKELYILLRHGPDKLYNYRNDSNWWG
jgi:hypothetical protein